MALHLRGTVRQHYLEWINRVRPDLAALHRERFRAGAYQPQAERDRISEVVRATATRYSVTWNVDLRPGDAGPDHAGRPTLPAVVGGGGVGVVVGRFRP